MPSNQTPLKKQMIDLTKTVPFGTPVLPDVVTTNAISVSPLISVGLGKNTKKKIHFFRLMRISPLFAEIYSKIWNILTQKTDPYDHFQAKNLLNILHLSAHQM